MREFYGYGSSVPVWGDCRTEDDELTRKGEWSCLGGSRDVEVESADSFCCFLCGDEYASGPCGKCHGGTARHIPTQYSWLPRGYPPGPVGVKPANRSVFFSPPMGCFRSPNEAWFSGADELDAYFDADDAERVRIRDPSLVDTVLQGLPTVSADKPLAGKPGEASADIAQKISSRTRSRLSSTSSAPRPPAAAEQRPRRRPRPT